MEEIKSIKSNVFFNSLYSLLNIVFPLITFSYASRCLMADGMGKVTFYMSIANYSMMLGSLGISTYGIRKIAQVRNDKKNLTKTIQELFLLNSFFTICVVVGLIILSIIVPKFNEDKGLLIINCIYILLAPLGMDWAYSGLEQYKYITVRSLVCKFVSLGLLFIFVHDKGDYLYFALITILAAVSSWIVNFIHIKSFVNWPFKFTDLRFKNHIKPMIYLFSSLLAVSVYTNVDTIMLGFISGNEQVGIYTVATKVKTVLLILVNSISAVLLPRMSYYLNNGEEKLFEQTIKKSISIIFFISIPLTIFFEIAASETIYILGGTGYEQAIIIMQIIMPILLISGFSNITGNQILIPQGRDLAFMTAVICGAVTNIILNAILMPRYAAIGAASTTLIAEVIQMSIQVYNSRDFLKKNVEFFYIIKIIIMSISVGIITVILSSKFIIMNHLALCFFIKGIIFWGVYLFALLACKDKMFYTLLKEVFIIVKNQFISFHKD